MAATKHAQLIKQDSQTYLTTALLQLLQSKALNEITVAQVVRRAGVSRMAFYRNFETLDDILITYFRPQITARFNDIMVKEPGNQKLTALGQFFVDFGDTLNLSITRGFESIIQRIFNQNMAILYGELVRQTNLTIVQQKYWTEFMSAGVYMIWRNWLVDGQQESLTEIHNIIGQFHKATLASFN